MKRTDDSPRNALDKKKRRMAKNDSEQSAKDRSENRTALNPARVSPEEIYRIAVIGFWLDARTLAGVLDDAYKRIFKDHHSGPRIALHSGYVIRHKPWPTGTEEVRDAAKQHNVAALFEAMMPEEGDAAYVAFDPREGMLPVKLYQRFRDSKQANAEPAKVAELVEDCGPNRQRTINLAGLRLGLLICGENNVLTNDQSDGNRAFVRHQPDARLFEDVPVVFNGAHTTMGNWSKIDQRLKFLSNDNRWTFYATNCVSDWGNSTVRGYYNRALVADSSMRKVNLPPDVKVQRFVDNESKDRYLALVFDIPGRLLAPMPSTRIR